MQLNKGPGSPLDAEGKDKVYLVHHMAQRKKGLHLCSSEVVLQALWVALLMCAASSFQSRRHLVDAMAFCAGVNPVAVQGGSIGGLLLLCGHVPVHAAAHGGEWNLAIMPAVSRRVVHNYLS